MSAGPRRAHGTGSLETRTDKYGREIYYGRFYVAGRQVKRKLGVKRRTGESTGLTKTGAERALQKLIDAEVRVVPMGERIDVLTAGERYLVHLDQVMHRRPTTLQDYTIMLHKHLAPFFSGRSLQRIDTQLVADYLIAKQREGLKSKTVGKQLTFLHGIFRHAMKKGWATANPIAAVDRPREPESDPDIRFLTHEELEALLRAVDDPEFSVVDYPLLLVAATCGLRQGELVALRWRDIDWTAGVIRVRRNYTRGHWGAPKSRRSSRAVPMIARTAGALDRFKSLAVPGGRRLGLRAPGSRLGPRRLEAPQALQEDARVGWSPAGALPRPAAHVRHPGRRVRRATADAAGVDGPPGLQDHADLRRLRAARGRAADDGAGVHRIHPRSAQFERG